MTELKKILSFALCILMIASIIPLSALKAGAMDVTFDDIVKAAGDVIRPNEGYYSSVNPNDNGAVSIGWIQWHANRALNLLRTIVDMDKEKALELLGEELYNEITNTATVWTTRIMTKDEAAKLSALLDTKNGHDAQDALAAGDMAAYINRAVALGVTDPSVLVYHADIENQCGSGGSLRVLKAASEIAGGYDKITLDILYEAALADTVAGKYAVRRQKTYNNCLLLEWKEIDTDLEVWDIIGTRNVRKNVETQEAESPLVTSLYAGTKVIIFEKAYYAKENSTRARTTMGWITLDPKYTTLNEELSGGAVPAPINFDTNGGSFTGVLASTKASDRNTLRGADQLIAYDSEYTGKNVPTNKYGTETVISANGEVTTAPAYGIYSSEIPEGGLVLSGHGTMGSWLSANVKKGYYVSFNKNTLEISVYKDKNAYLAATCTTSMGAEFGELPTPKKSGYIFCGWQDSEGNAISLDTACSTPMCMTLKASWEQSEGTKIIYNKEGGSFKNTVDAKVDAVNIGREANALVVYYGSATTGQNEHGTEVCVDANGKITAIYGYGNKNAPIPEGGFVISSHGDASGWLASFIAVGSVVEFDEEAMTITAYKDESTYNDIHKAITADEEIGTLPEMEKQYHKFLGWYTPAGEKAAETTVMPEGGIVLSARWEVLPGKIVYNANGGTITSLKSEAEISGTNIIRGANALVIFKNRSQTQTNAYGVEVLVGIDGVIDFVHPSGIGNTVIPAGSFVLSGHGTMATWLMTNAKAGNYVTVENGKAAIWESYDAYVASKNTTSLFGNKAGDLLTPKREGHIFLGWQDTNGNTVIADSTVSVYGDLVLTAQWEKLLTVTFDAGEGKIAPTGSNLKASSVNTIRNADTLVIYTGISSTQTNKYGTEVIVSKDGTVTAINGYGKGNSTVPVGGMVLSAHGAAATEMLKYVKVGSYVTVSGYNVLVYDSLSAFDADDGRMFIKKGSPLGALANATHPSKALSGWASAGDRFNKDSIITSDITLFSVWTALSAEVVFNTDGGSFGGIVSSQKVNGTNTQRPADSIIIYDSTYPGAVSLTNRYGTEVAVDKNGVILSTPVYGSYRTAIPEGGMVISGIGTGYNWMVKNLKAGQYVHFDKGTLTLSVYDSYSAYVANTGKTIYTGKAYGTLPTPKKDGYIFCGWKDGAGNVITETTVVTSCDVPVLTAVWKRQYTVTLSLSEGTLASDKNTATGVNTSRGAEDLIIYYGKASSGTNKYGTEAAVDASGKVIALYPYGNKNAVIPSSGYVISGHGNMGTWVGSALKVGRYVHIEGTSIKVYDTKEAMTAEIEGRIILLDGSQTAVIPTPKKTGHNFLGWYNNGILFAEGTPITGNIILTARFEKKTISVKYDLDGGSFAQVIKKTADKKNVHPRPAEELVIYDNSFSYSSTKTNKYGAEIVVSAEGIVTEVRPYGMSDATIPEGGFVLSGHNTAGTWLTQNIKVGYYVVLSENDISVYQGKDQYDLITKKTVLFGDAIGSLPEAAKSGASFAGWMLPDGTLCTQSTLITYDVEEITLKAKWN